MSHGEHRGEDWNGVDLKDAVDLTPYIVTGSGFLPGLFPDHVRRLQKIEEQEARRAYQTRPQRYQTAYTYHAEALLMPPRTELERRNYARMMAWMTLIPAKLKPLIHNGRKPRK